MKKLAVLILGAAALSAGAQVFVQPYVRSDGTYVPGHMRSAPDHNPYNNYSSQGNVNPYTGQAGTVNPYLQPAQPIYQQQQRQVIPVQPIQQQPLGGLNGRLF